MSVHILITTMFTCTENANARTWQHIVSQSKYWECLPADYQFLCPSFEPPTSEKEVTWTKLAKIARKTNSVHDVHAGLQITPSVNGVCERAEGNSTFLFHPIHLPEWFLVLRRLQCQMVGPHRTVLNEIENLEMAKHLEDFTSSSHLHHLYLSVTVLISQLLFF